MFIHKVCETLNKAKIPYAVVGGYAVALHGVVRGTIDVDIVIKWSLKNLINVETSLKSLGLVSRIPVNAENVFQFRDEYITNRNLIAWNFYNPARLSEQIDIIINYDLTHAHVDSYKSSGGTIKILSLSDLIKMKRKSGRPQDLADVKALEAL